MPAIHIRLHSPAHALIIALCACTLLAACSVLPKREPVQIWKPPQGGTAIAHADAHFSLRVDAPNATGMLDGKGIVVMPQPGQLNVYKGARWSQPPAVLVRERLVDAFMAAGLPSVTTNSDHLASDYALGGNLREYRSEYRAGKPVVVVRYDAQLRRGRSRHVLAARSFVITERPAGSQVPQIVAAFGAADDALAAQVVPWVIDAVRNAGGANKGKAARRRR